MYVILLYTRNLTKRLITGANCELTLKAQQGSVL